MRRRSTSASTPALWVKLLLKWFSENARDLPWRRTRDPYAVWVSEIMLQQTQVQTVIPYWERWMSALPNVRALSMAPAERVLKLWEGLGYYSRARNLQRAARQIMTSHAGVFPTTLEAILELPGIGGYTAGAIASIAFNQACPILDGNVIRVLSRLCAWPGNPRRRPLNSRLWALAARLVKRAAAPRFKALVGNLTAGSCSAFNQALMELGALICTPRQPRCPKCPLKRHCRARRLERVERFPAIPGRVRTIRRRMVVVVLEHNGRVLVTRRASGTMNGLMWEFPSRELNDTEDAVSAAAAWLRISSPRLTEFMSITHSITRYRIRLEVLRAKLTGPISTEFRSRWITRDELNSLALSSAHRRIAQELAA